ncbi:hypothetical protein [Mycoplana dimorpha]|uniref:Citrate lyase beta subunit n=1 Tax=Mycoplana dimorpha TaxID=28320 RepID=A0A2T5B7L1_MYCDI|nr:hypothetical protein [Mycoplana dimorpha]PTM94976.1 citrate lyase beta subunit [Mycoplana dimorpha]
MIKWRPKVPILLRSENASRKWFTIGSPYFLTPMACYRRPIVLLAHCSDRPAAIQGSMAPLIHSLLFLTERGFAPGGEPDALLCHASTPVLPDIDLPVFLEPANGSEAALRSLMQRAPAGVVLSDCRTGADVQRLDVLLSVAEAEEGIPLGQTRILATTDGLLPLPFSEAAFGRKSRRLAGLVWDWRLLATTLGATRLRADGRWTDAFALARATTLLTAKASGIAVYDVSPPLPESDFAADCIGARHDGFDGRMTDNPEQVAAINAAFRTRAPA